MNNPCDEIRDLIADSVTEPLPAEQAGLLDEHLHHCPDCRKYAEALRREDLLLSGLAAGIATEMPGRKERLVQTLGHRQRERFSTARWRGIREVGRHN